MLMSDFQRTVQSELDRDIEPVRASQLAGTVGGADCQVDECVLSSLILGLVRQRSYSFLEYLEESAITAVKIVIRVSLVPNFWIYIRPGGPKICVNSDSDPISKRATAR